MGFVLCTAPGRPHTKKSPVSIRFLIIYPFLMVVRNGYHKCCLCSEDLGAEKMEPTIYSSFFYLQTHPRAGQSPVEPWLYPPFPPALISNAIPQRVKLPETSPHSQWFMFNLYKWRKWDFKFQCHFCNEVIKRERGIAFYCIEYWSQCYFP